MITKGKPGLRCEDLLFLKDRLIYYLDQINLFSHKHILAKVFNQYPYKLHNTFLRVFDLNWS